MKTTITLLVFVFSILVWYLSALPHHFTLARKTGLPIHFTPITPSNPLWLVISSLLGYSVLERLLPRFIFDNIKIIIVGWEARCYHEVNDRWGTMFVLVSPGGNTVYIADPSAANAVLTRRKDFGRIEIASKIMGVFGPNLISSDNDEWKRHRRIVAPILNERIMGAVWNEATTQTDDMLALIESSANLGRSSDYVGTTEDMKTITINVIGSVGFGTLRSFSDSSNTKPPEGFTTTSMDAVLSIVNNFLVAILVPSKLLLLPFMPQSAKRIGIAKLEFPLHLRDKIAEERKTPGEKNTLISTLVRIADASAGEATKTSNTSLYLSEEEITGNLFNFTIAGFDTTANTLTYAIMELAIHPEWQDWIFEGIDEVSQVHPNGDYSETFPLLTRCLALMVCLQVIHASPKIWGDDSLSFRPSRWAVGGRHKCETLLEPEPGEFMPWSGGPRFCPGIKMSQVEFVAVIKKIFGEWRVEAVERAGESQVDARKRLAKTVAEGSVKLTVQMSRPQDAILRWVRR